MKRRSFNKIITYTSAGLVLNPYARSTGLPEGPMDRIGMSTVNFRNRFPETRAKGVTPDGPDLILPDVPEFFQDRFQVHNVEFWSHHFPSIEPAYLKELKAAVKKAKCKLINIQFDESYQLGDPDPAKRGDALHLAIQWVDVAKRLGSGAIRVNPGNGDFNHVIEALKIINKAAKRKGIVLMTENHFGMEMDPDIHLRITRLVGKNMYTLPDFGNYPDDVRYRALEKIMPYAYQVSVKTIDFDENMNHTSFDFDKCMQIAVDSGFKGIYSVEQWSPNPVKAKDDAIADWMIEKVKPYCK